MKKLLLLSLVSLNTVNAEISFKDLYCKTTAITGALAGAGYLLSRACERSENAHITQAIFGAAGLIAGAYYYANWHPESRLSANQNNFAILENKPLLSCIVQSLDEWDNVASDILIDRIFIYYLDIRNPYYHAFQDMVIMKKQAEAILSESRKLIRFYNLCQNKNTEYCAALEKQIEMIQPIIAVITDALIAMKNTQEYKDAVALQIEIEKNESLDRIASSQQTQAINSCARISTMRA